MKDAKKDGQFGQGHWWRLIADHTCDWESWLGPDGRLVYVSPSCEQMTGRSPAEFLADPGLLESIVHPDDRPAVSRHFHEGQQDREPASLEFRVVRPDGQQRWIEHVCQPVYESDGSFLGRRASNRDITPRKTAEAALQQSLERIEALAEAAFDGIVLSEQGRTIDINQRFAEMLGYEKPELVGVEISRLIAPADRKAVMANIRANRESVIEHDMVLKDGGLIRVEAHGKPSIYQGREARVTAVRDITAHKAALKARGEHIITAEFLRLVNESSGTRDLIQATITFLQRQSGCEAVGVRLEQGDDYPYYEARGFPPEFVLVENKLCRQDNDGNLVRDTAGNPVIECMCGNVICGRFDPAKPFFTARGSFWTNSTTRLLASTTDADRQVLTRNRCNGEGYESVALIPLHLGPQRLGLLQLNDRRRDQFSAEVIGFWERLAGHLAVALGKCRAEESLARSSQQRLLLAEVSARVVAQTTEEGVLRTVIDAACELTAGQSGTAAIGYTKDRFRLSVVAAPGSPGSVSSPGPFKIENGGVYIDLMQHGPSLRLTDAELRGHPAWWGLPAEHPRLHGLLGVTLLDVLGRPDGLIMVSGKQDGSEFTEEDEMLLRQLASITSLALQHIEARAAAETANAAKSQFVANMSHELRTPMHAILGMTELALAERLPPTARDCLQTSQESANSLLGLLNDILDFSRIESGKLRLESIGFELRALIDRTLTPLRLQARQKGLKLICDVPNDVPDRLVGDPLRLRQILTNLVSNAVKFTEVGTVTVRAAARDRQDDRVGLELVVADTGIGISIEDQKKIFNPFAQAETSTTRRYGGTGLGLSIVHSLVGLMGGRIRLESRPGSGSEFSCWLPLGVWREPRAEAVSATVDAAAPAGTPIVAARSLRILLAEDTPALQHLFVRVLEDHGHRVEVADNGRAAVELVGQEDFDVVLMDVRMPVMDGLEATAAIRNLDNAEKARVPIIALTAHALESDEQRCLAAGMNAYMSKPINNQKLTELVEQLVAGCEPPR